ncbi:MAG: ATP-binding cassette domain-containing protein, partial [Myxococcales bacterium]|nr:ATP-binding cassette domain-containing protein [Myxococcales bacterium]
MPWARRKRGSPMKGDPWLLGARDLSLGYEGRAVLAGVDFAIGRGERWSILGPNGAGKSTLMAALAGLL